MNLKFIGSTILTGAVLLIPIGALLYLCALIFVSAKKFVTPIVDYFEIQSFLGFILLNSLALFVVVLVCFLAGLTARMAFISNRVQKLDQTLAKVVPGYSLIVGTLRGTISGDTSVETMRPVVVVVGKMTRLGFEIERAPSGQVVVFLPGVPNAQSGFAAAFPSEDVSYVEIAPHRIMEMMQFYGKGLSALIAESAVADNEPSA
jgi:uncharacterized membrane protein